MSCHVSSSTLLGNVFCCLFLTCVVTQQKRMLISSVMSPTCHEMLHVIDIVAIQLITVTYDNSN